MEHQKLRDEIQNLISNNQTEEAFELLSNVQFTKTDKALIILSSQYNRIKEEQRLNVISGEAAERGINKINLSLLDLSNNLGSNKKSFISELNPKKGKSFNLKLLWLLLLPIAGYLMFLGLKGEKSPEPIKTCEETTISAGIIYKIESPVGYLTLSSEALSVEQEKDYIKKGNNPKYLAKLNNGLLVRVTDASLPRYIKVIIESSGSNNNKTGYITKCKDGKITISAYDKY